MNRLASPRTLSRRRLIGAAGLLASSAVLAACAAAPTPTSTAAPAPPTPTAAPRKATFLIYGGEAEQKAWHARAEGFAVKYPGSTVEVMLQPTAYNEKLLSMFASNTAPDTFAAFSVRELAPKGVLMQLDDRLKEDREFDLDDLMPGALDGGKWQGRQYAIPGGLGPQVTFFNAVKFKEAGLLSPIELAAKGEWTYDKMREVSAKLTTKDTAGKVKAFGYLPYTQFYTYTHGNAAGTFNGDYTQALLDEEAATTILQQVADLALKDRSAPQSTEMQQYGSWQGFAQGNYGMFISGPWQQARLGANMKDSWDIAPPPLNKGGSAIMNAGGNGTAVYAKAADPDTAYRWATFSEGKEGQRIWAGLGFDLPSRKSLAPDYAAGKFFSDPKFKPDNVALWFDLVPRSKRSPHTYLPAEASTKLDVAWANVLKGVGSAKDEFGKVIKDVNAILKEQ